MALLVPAHARNDAILGRETHIRVGLDVHQGITPREQAAQNYDTQASGIISAVWLHHPLLEQGELFTQEEVLGSECAARPGNEHEEVGEIALWTTTS